MWPGRFVLASSVEHFDMPLDLVAIVHESRPGRGSGSRSRTRSPSPAGAAS